MNEKKKTLRTIKNDLPKLLYVIEVYNNHIKVKLTNKDNKRKLNCFLCCFYYKIHAQTSEIGKLYHNLRRTEMLHNGQTRKQQQQKDKFSV